MYISMDVVVDVAIFYFSRSVYWQYEYVCLDMIVLVLVMAFDYVVLKSLFECCAPVLCSKYVVMSSFWCSGSL